MNKKYPILLVWPHKLLPIKKPQILKSEIPDTGSFVATAVFSRITLLGFDLRMKKNSKKSLRLRLN